jgi:hypothetical protein
MSLVVTVQVFRNPKAMRPWREYNINHDDAQQRRVLGEQVANAFRAGQKIVTFPQGYKK